MSALGSKYNCYSCHTKFYDLGKTVPICPKCGADQRDAEEAPVAASHRGGRRAAIVVEEVFEDEVEVAEDVVPEEEPADEEIIGEIEPEPVEEEEEEEEY